MIEKQQGFQYAYISREQFLAKCEPKPMIGGMDARSGAILGAIGALAGWAFILIVAWSSHLC